MDAFITKHVNLVIEGCYELMCQVLPTGGESCAVPRLPTHYHYDYVFMCAQGLFHHSCVSLVFEAHDRL